MSHTRGLWARICAVTALVCCCASAAQSTSRADPGSGDFKARAVFELVNHQSGVIRQGSSRIVARSAYVTHTTELFPGKTEGWEIQFFTTPMTEAARTDVLDNGARELRTSSDYATLVLFLDKNRAVWQVNLGYVIPGTTVARTVAWKPEELKSVVSHYEFDGKRVRLKSKGVSEEVSAKQETMTLSWDVECDLPVFERVRR